MPDRSRRTEAALSICPVLETFSGLDCTLLTDARSTEVGTVACITPHVSSELFGNPAIESREPSANPSMSLFGNESRQGARKLRQVDPAFHTLLRLVGRHSPYISAFPFSTADEHR